MTAFVFNLAMYQYSMKSIFEEELRNQGFLFQETSDRYYSITPRNRIVLPTKVQLVVSKPINPIYHGSQNGNELDGIGFFLFSLNTEPPPDFMVFSFQHVVNDKTEYMIIPTQELRRRLKKNLIRYRNGEHLEFRLWLMDGHLYQSNNLSVESEWYYLSKGKGGRMIDSTIWNYTSFWNNWVLGPRD
jgi:hypothetical protein